MKTIIAAISISTMLNACAGVEQGLTQGEDLLKQYSETRQRIDRDRLYFGTATICGAGYDVHIEAANRNSDWTLIAPKLCGDKSNLLLPNNSTGEKSE